MTATRFHPRTLNLPGHQAARRQARLPNWVKDNWGFESMMRRLIRGELYEEEARALGVSKQRYRRLRRRAIRRLYDRK
ncbi:hypothetical protein AB7M74_011288 [Bradyrhizobium japonicum]